MLKNEYVPENVNVTLLDDIRYGILRGVDTQLGHFCVVPKLFVEGFSQALDLRLRPIQVDASKTLPMEDLKLHWTLCNLLDGIPQKVKGELETPFGFACHIESSISHT